MAAITLADLSRLAATPAACEEAETYRAALGKMTDMLAKELEDELGRLEWCYKRLPFSPRADREVLGSTIKKLTEDRYRLCKGRAR